MSNMNKKKRKNSFLKKISHVFKRKHNELEQAEFHEQAETFDNRQSNQLESVSHNSDNKIVPLAVGKNETCITATKDSLFGIEKYSDKHISDECMQQYKNVVTAKSDKGFRLDVGDDKRIEGEKCSVMKNEQEECKLGADRHMSTKIAFLKQDNNLCQLETTSQSHLKTVNNRSEDFSFNSGSAMLQLSSNNANVINNTRTLVVKETKAIFQESSEDSDFSADSTEDSFEESSEDENEHLIESEKTQKYLKDEYFTKGKYITYFFLEMERQFYNPSEVYKMVQYHDTDCEKPEKEGIR